MKTFSLYGTSACHLCETAASMLEEQRAERRDFDVLKVDIADSDALFERYGLIIPVLAHPDGTELNWPFSAHELQALLDR